MPTMSSSSLSSPSLYYRSLWRLVERKKKVKKDNLTTSHSNSEELVTDINGGQQQQQQFAQPAEAIAHDTSQLKEGARHRKMDRIRRSFRESFRRRMSKHHFGSSGNSPRRQSSNGSASNSVNMDKAELWQPDEVAVRNGTCSFNVKYLGGIEVFESRGMQICEGALKLLRGQQRPPIKAILYVSGDGLRVVDQESNRGLIVDQTIEKVSFCAPDRNHEKGFAYICRDGTSRRWMCHGFHTTKESGERLSHAVGCAFAICLERKKKRDAEATAAVQAAAGLPPLGTEKSKRANFTLNEIAQQVPAVQTSPAEREINNGSFRRLSITERLRDPQTAIIQVPPPTTTASSDLHITPKPRPVGNPLLFEREGSLRAPASSVNGSAALRRRFSLRCCPDSVDNWQQRVQSQTVLRKNEPIFEDEEEKFWQNNVALNEKTTFEYAPYDVLKYNGFRQSLSYTATPPNTTDQCNFARSTVNSPVQMQTNCSLNASTLQPWLSDPVSSCSLRGKSKADEWLEKTLRSSLSVSSPQRNANDENKTKNVIGEVGLLPGCSLPPPPGSSAARNSVERWSDTDNKTLEKVGQEVAFFNDFMHSEPPPGTVNFAHLAEGTLSPSTSEDPGIDVFGQPVFTPLSPKAGVQKRGCLNGLTAGVGALKPEEPDPFDVRWFEMVVNAAKTDTAPVRSTNPFCAELNAVTIQ